MLENGLMRDNYHLGSINKIEKQLLLQRDRKHHKPLPLQPKAPIYLVVLL